MDEEILVTNIQRFSLHDGPGIRTTVFLKGCSLHCPWCANPENIMFVSENYHKDGQDGMYGHWFTVDELYREVMKDWSFYGQASDVSDAYEGMPGGVTFSGGEPLLQMTALEPLLKRLKESNTHLCVETALFVSKQLLEIAMQYIDLFYVDVKIMNAVQCQKVLGGNLEQYQENVQVLFAAGKSVVFRVPVIGGFTDGAENQKSVIAWMKQYKPLKVELIKEHNLGRNKYLTLGKEPLMLDTVTDELMEQYQRDIVSHVPVETEICKV